MRASLHVAGVGFALAVTSFTPTAAAEPKDEVAAATAVGRRRWVRMILRRSFRAIPVMRFFGGPYPRNSGPIRQRCGTVSWATSRLFPV